MPYISARIYDLLCQPDDSDLTLAKFLKNLRPLFAGGREGNKFVFDVLDMRGDGYLTGDEIDAVLADLVPDTMAYKEVMRYLGT